MPAALQKDCSSTEGRGKLSPKDVICAKGLFGGNHPGNVRYNKVIQSFQKEYSYCKRRSEETRIVREIIATITRYGGRFVRYNGESGSWERLSSDLEREKVLHALRGVKDSSFVVTSIRKEDFSDTGNSEDRASTPESQVFGPKPNVVHDCNVVPTESTVATLPDADEAPQEMNLLLEFPSFSLVNL